jgi:threonine/homoserine/homoserine lactone efflux protein
MIFPIALLLFVAAGLFSPGPNVVMLTASGARFGFRATLPHLLGVPIGTGLLAAASALGLSAILLAAPTLKHKREEQGVQRIKADHSPL